MKNNTFDSEEVYTLLAALDLLREEYEDETDILINAVENINNFEAVKQYQKQKIGYAHYIACLKSKILKHSKNHTHGKRRGANTIRRAFQSVIAGIG